MCEEREQLLDYVYDACDAAERQRIERHLEACQDCRGEISSLRAVRLQLLAWDVPEHGSVWTPFAPARVKPWYREVPAWALAAAASVTFAIGLAGGVVSRQLMPVQVAAAPQPQIPAAVVTPTLTPSTTNADMAAMERRILTNVQSQMDRRLQPVAAHIQTAGAGVTHEEMVQEMQRMLAASEDRVLRSMLQDSQRTFVTQSKFNNFRNTELPAYVRYEATQAAQLQGNKQ